MTDCYQHQDEPTFQIFQPHLLMMNHNWVYAEIKIEHYTAILCPRDYKPKIHDDDYVVCQKKTMKAREYPTYWFYIIYQTYSFAMLVFSCNDIEMSLMHDASFIIIWYDII